ncbi:hypothetical protein E2C01_049089 [Portunus trituberculatus]|uniref:Uncharacterized protein n=1 Tax=Portunus trituberculatus TaxID=210409 RepID=A0A5B7GDA0_PORTR|nr:hypothetical protein [Portunus trituberculatus]
MRWLGIWKRCRRKKRHGEGDKKQREVFTHIYNRSNAHSIKARRRLGEKEMHVFDKEPCQCQCVARGTWRGTASQDVSH